MVTTNTFMELFLSLRKWRIDWYNSTIFGGNKGDVTSGLARAVGGSCWRL